jgi:hypothetical protein
MKKPDFITVTVGNRCFDYPKDFYLPRIGEYVFFDHICCKITEINYHVNGKKLWVSMFAE